MQPLWEKAFLAVMTNSTNSDVPTDSTFQQRRSLLFFQSHPEALADAPFGPLSQFSVFVFDQITAWFLFVVAAA